MSVERATFTPIMNQASSGVLGVCREHQDRVGAPCVRCGTFRCPECLTAGGLCPLCVRGASIHAPRAEETVGFGRRGAARVIDMVAKQLAALGGALLVGLVLAVLQELGAVAPGWAQRLDGGALANLAIGILAGLASDVPSVMVCGATPGKALLGLRVVGEDGGRAGLRAALVRELAFFADGFFFGAIGYAAMDGSPLKQRHGDRWAHTVVVRAASLAPPVRASADRLLVGLGLGLFLHALVIAASFVFLVLR